MSMYPLAHGSSVASQIATYQQDPSICISGSVPSHLYSRSLPVSHWAWWQKHSSSLPTYHYCPGGDGVLLMEQRVHGKPQPV